MNVEVDFRIFAPFSRTCRNRENYFGLVFVCALLNIIHAKPDVNSIVKLLSFAHT